MRKVLFLAYFFPPAGGAGVQRSLKFVKYLPDEGYLPSVVTGPTSPDSRWTPHDRSLISEIPSEVKIHRVSVEPPLPGSRMRSRMERWLWTPTMFSQWWIQSATQLGRQVGKGVELVFATMSPFESGEVARQLSLQLGVPWVADLRDPWALDEMQVYPSWLHRKVELRRMERLLSTASLIIMNTPEALKALKSAFPSLCRNHLVAITNGYDDSDFAAQLPPRNDQKFRIVHTGYFHTDSGMQLRKRNFYRMLGGAEAGVDILTRSHAVLLQAIGRWCEERPEIKDVLEIVFAGKTSEEDRTIASESPIFAMIKFLGYLSHQQSVNLVRTADLLFLPMPTLPAGRRSRIVPGKTYEYMAAGRPILGAVPEGDAKDFISNSGLGVTCRPDDVNGMIQALDQVYADWKDKKSSRLVNERFVSQFERRNLAGSLAAAFNTLLNRSVSSNTAAAS
jgi:glycosyltransferase involved in cell wall biosynthesis